MARTMSIRMDEENYRFLQRLSTDEKVDMSGAVRELVYKGRILMAIERYRQRRASLGRAAELAGVPVGDMIEILAAYGVESNLEIEDYRKGLDFLRKGPVTTHRSTTKSHKEGPTAQSIRLPGE
jgi:predicted HTH domain antitoxin